MLLLAYRQVQKFLVGLQNDGPCTLLSTTLADRLLNVCADV
jgi:hypothetical protein